MMNVAQASRAPSPVYNFGSGPGMIAPEVLRQAQEEMLDWQGSGISMWEMPFTGSEFQAVADQARQDLRELLEVPDHFRILFMQGGASAQFSLVPMNLLGRGGSADYVDSGHWSAKAIAEGRRYCQVRVAASSRAEDYCRLPEFSGAEIDPGAAYCHITSNETANGVQYQTIPDTGAVPLVADMTSDFLARPIDFERFALVYAGAQKNIGPAGLTVVIVRKDLIREPMPTTPSAFSYRVVDETNGRFNTPLTYAVYLAGLVFRQLKADGGVAAAAERNRRKSRALYQMIDRHPAYHCAVRPDCRSTMNHCFALSRPQLTQAFLEAAAGRGLINLAGHSAAGDLRASLYNAMPMAGVERLIEFMQEFAESHGATP